MADFFPILSDEEEETYSPVQNKQTAWVPKDASSSRLVGSTYGEVRKLKKDFGAEFQAMSPTPPSAATQPPRPKTNVPFMPISAKSRKPVEDKTGLLLAKNKELEEKHKEELWKKDVQIHYLRCTLGMENQTLLDNVDTLVSKTPVRGWTPFERLKKVSDMNPGEIEKEICVRGGKHLIVNWEIKAKGKHPPKIVDPAGGTRLMTKEYFCRNTLRDLRAKTVGLAIPLRKYSGPVPSKMPTPIAPPVKPDPLYLHPCPPGSRAVKIDVKSTAQTIQNAVRPKQSPPTSLPDSKKNRTLTKPVASGSVTPSPSPTPPFTLPSVKVLSHGKEVTLKVVSGENDPSKKTPVEKRPYNKIWNWEAGCPDCGKTSKSKEAFRKHRSDKGRCKPKT